MKYVYSLILGTFFGILIVKGEIISWFRIQEMFRFESFHMFGIIGSAVAVGALSVLLIKKFKAKSITGDPIEVKQKPWKPKANFSGGFLFGLGWALTGSCPAPLYAHLGYGHSVIIIAILWAVLGVFVYGKIKDRLPH